MSRSPPKSLAGEELTAITRCYDLVREMTRRVGRFPREQRFLLGDRILRNLYDVLDLDCGVPFLGWRVYPDHRRLKRSSGVRFQRRLRELAQRSHTGEATMEDVRASLASYLGHLKHGDTWGLRRNLLAAVTFRWPKAVTA